MAAEVMANEIVAQVEAWCSQNAGWTWRGVEQPVQGSTNRVVFVRRGEELRVCKIFCEQERRDREVFALRHWDATGLVPKLVGEVGSRMIVTTFVPGAHLVASRGQQSRGEWVHSCYEAGWAMARLSRVSLSDSQKSVFEFRFYRELPTLAGYLGWILELGRKINAADAGFAGEFWKKSLDFAKSQIPGILAERPRLYHQDVGNLHVQAGRFMGFYDLEMCRVGCASMQLGSMMEYIEREPAVWQPMREGWEAGVGYLLDEPRLLRALAVHHLLCWRVISRYMSYDGTPGSGYPWAEAADPVWCRRSIEAAHAATGIAPEYRGMTQ